MRNLNVLVKHPEPQEVTRARVRVAFCNCEREVVGCISGCDSVKICVAWLTNMAIIEALKFVPCQVVVTADKMHRKVHKHLRSMKARKIGKASGKFRSLMHHKFLVGCVEGKPMFVLTGSYNYSAKGAHNIENIIRIDSPTIARRYAEEADALYAAGRSV